MDRLGLLLGGGVRPGGGTDRVSARDVRPQVTFPFDGLTWLPHVAEVAPFLARSPASLAGFDLRSLSHSRGKDDF